MSCNAKISDRSREIARTLSQETGRAQIDIIEQALLVYERQLRMQTVNETYLMAQEDVVAYQAFQEEIADWDKRLGDGLDEE